MADTNALRTPIVPEYELITTRKGLRDLARRCAKCAHGTGFDVETTSLDPSTGRVRLAQFFNNRGISAIVDFDRIKGGFRACAAELDRFGLLIAFYSVFENRWLLDAGATNFAVDVWFLRCAVVGGGRSSLAKFAEYDLGYDLSKEEQNSNWAAKRLTDSQYDYAILDAMVTWELWWKYKQEADPGQISAFTMFDDMVPAVIEMEDSGMLLDQAAHRKLVDGWKAERDSLVTTIRDLVPEGEVVNINSDTQWNDYFAARMPDAWLDNWPRTSKSGQLSMKANTLRGLAAYAPPLSPLRTFFLALADYKGVAKYLSSFGDNLINIAERSLDGRIHARFNIAAAVTGRFSSSGPNLQNIPRGNHVRESFIAAPRRVLVSLDYSGIELRVLALLAEDDQLLNDVVYGDVHLEVAREAFRNPDLTKETPEGYELRSQAKRISFLIIYGGGAPGLAASMGVTVARAQEYIDFWESRYPRAFALRHTVMTEAQSKRFIRVTDGGTIYMGKRPELPKCANYPVQRTALSVMAKAIARHKRSLDELRANRQQRLTKILGTIHDALIDECAKGSAEQLLKVMHDDMTQGYLDIFPGAPTHKLVEGGVGSSWGNLE